MVTREKKMTDHAVVAYGDERDEGGGIENYDARRPQKVN